MAKFNYKRPRAAQARMNVAGASMSNVYKAYSKTLVGRLEKAMPKLMLGKCTSLAEAQMRGMEIMADVRYWKELNGVLDEALEAGRNLPDGSTGSEAKKKITGVLAEIASGAERLRMKKALSELGLERAWDRFLDGMVHVAKESPWLGVPPEMAQLSERARKEFLNFQNHEEFLRGVFGMDAQQAKKCAEQIMEHSGLSSKHLDLINESLRWKIPPESHSFFRLLDPKQMAAYNMRARAQGMGFAIQGAMGGRGMLWSAIESVAKAKEVEYRYSAGRRETEFSVVKDKGGKFLTKEGQPSSRLLRLLPAPEEKIASGAARKFSSYAAAGLAAAAAAYLLIWAGSGGIRGRRGETVPKPKRVEDALEDELRPICAFSGNRKSIIKMLNNMGVGGRRLTAGEKLRAVKIAKLSKKKYSGAELEKYIKVAAILQFAHGLGNSSVATLSGKVVKQAGLSDAGKLARDLLDEAASGKK